MLHRIVVILAYVRQHQIIMSASSKGKSKNN